MRLSPKTIILFNLLLLFGLSNAADLDSLLPVAKSYWRKNPARSIELADTIINSLQDKNSTPAADAHYTKGIAYWYLGDFKNALIETQRALEIYEELDVPSGKASCYNAFGMISEFSGLYTESLKYFQKALSIAEEEQMEPERWATYMNIGVIHGHLENHELALEYFNQVLDNVKDPENYAPSGLIYANIAETYRKLGQYTNAKEYYVIALDFFKSNEDLVDLSLHLTSYGNLLLDLDLTEQAYDTFLEGYVLSDSLGLDDRKVQNLIGLINTLKKRNDFQGIRKLLDENIDLFAKIQNPRTRLKLLKVQIDYTKGTGDFQNAFNYSQAYQSLNDSLLNVKQDAQFSQMETLHQLDTMKKENDSLKDYLKAIQKFNLAVAISLVVFLGLIILISKFYSSKEASNRKLAELNKALISNQEELEAKAGELEEANQEISRINNLLEKKIEERTKDLVEKNKKIIDFIFINSHQVRGTLARIMGLIELSPKEEKDQENESVQNLLNDQVLELDKLVNKINDLLTEEESNI